MFTLLVIILILALLGLLIVSNYDDVVFCSFDSDEFNRFRFLFIRVEWLFCSRLSLLLITLNARLLFLRACLVVLAITYLEKSLWLFDISDYVVFPFIYIM